MLPWVEVAGLCEVEVEEAAAAFTCVVEDPDVEDETDVVLLTVDGVPGDVFEEVCPERLPFSFTRRYFPSEETVTV
jgi:hypothetical protein